MRRFQTEEKLLSETPHSGVFVLTMVVYSHPFDVSVPISVPAPTLVSVPLSVLSFVPMSVPISEVVSVVSVVLSLVPAGVDVLGVDVPGAPVVSFVKSELSSHDVRITLVHNTAESTITSESNIAVAFLFLVKIFISAPFFFSILIFTRPCCVIQYDLLSKNSYALLLLYS